jgi:hypothetical protein
MDSNDVKDAAREVGDHRAVETLARVGYGASGLLHLVMGYIALKVAWSGSGEKADQSGALALLAGNTAGRLLLWVLVVGFWGLALWQLTEAIVGRGETSDRAKAAAKFVMYLTLGWAAFGFARGQGNSSSDQTQGFTAELMSHTGGQLLVGAIGLAVIGVGIYHVHKGWSQKFLRHLVEHPGRWATIAGRVGYIAKGIALAVVGGLFVTAALHENSSEASGLDGALRTLRDQPFGQWLLTLVALGLAAYGIYSFSRARHAKV